MVGLGWRFLVALLVMRYDGVVRADDGARGDTHRCISQASAIRLALGDAFLDRPSMVLCWQLYCTSKHSE